MAVRRIVANLEVADPQAGLAFYRDFLGLEVAMDLGFVVTLAGSLSQRVEVSLAREGGSGAPVPDLSVEVDDVDACHARAMAAGLEVVYGITDEPWGVRRFFVRDPFGRVVNLLSHRGEGVAGR